MRLAPFIGRVLIWGWRLGVRNVHFCASDLCSPLTCLLSRELHLHCLLVLEKVRTLASAGGPDNLVLLDPGKYKAKSRPPTSPAGEGSGSPPAWQIGEQEFEALMRMLDNLVRMWPPLHGKAFILQHECCFHFLNFFPFLRLHP